MIRRIFRKTIENIIVDSFSGAVIGGASGITDSLTGIPLLGEDLYAFALSAALSGPSIDPKNPRYLDNALGFASFYLLYKIGYLGSKVIYEAIKNS